MLKAVLLDLDGTLVDSVNAHAQAWGRAFRRFGYDVPAQRIAWWIGMGGEKLMRRVDASLSDDREPGTSISELHDNLFLQEYGASLKPTNGARNLLERIGEKKLSRVIASAANDREQEILLKVVGIEGLVDVTTDPNDVDRSKPDPDTINLALRQAGVSADEAAYVGDTPYDITAAHRGGVIAVGLTCGVWDAAGLAGAEAVYRDPADLVRCFASSPLGNP